MAAAFHVNRALRRDDTATLEFLPVYLPSMYAYNVFHSGHMWSSCNWHCPMPTIHIRSKIPLISPGVRGDAVPGNISGKPTRRSDRPLRSDCWEVAH